MGASEAYCRRHSIKIRMKCLIAFVVLLGVALADKPYYESFKIERRIMFLCSGDDDWREVELLPWMQRKLDDHEFQVLDDHCFDAKSIAGIMTRWHKKFKKCEPKRLAHFFMAVMDQYHSLCMEGSEEIAACIGALYGNATHQGVLPYCAFKEPKPLLPNIPKKNGKCRKALKATETCVEAIYEDLEDKRLDACRIPGEAEMLSNFMRELNDEVDALITEKKRHKITCKVLAELF